MAGVVTPYGLMEGGMALALLPLYPAPGAAWIRPALARLPWLCWLIYLMTLAVLGYALYARASGDAAVMRLPLILAGLLYWFVFVRIDNEPASTAGKGEAS